MSLTSYRAAPPRDGCAFGRVFGRFIRGGVGVAPGLAAPGLAPMGLGLGVYEIVLRAIEAWCYGLFLSGLAVTYSPTT